ncbi:dimethyl sulfoxide reductase anchor subunit family protein [Vibrio sp. YIC-376]|uniref:dimethyl sulfoxide reductase anchor subunit family protein n=1 Tax=Vibrio sp. YIC-376 TaxID=3136162 RepID=UPI00402B047D
MKELPLVFFTVLAQASAGAFILMQICALMKKIDQKQATKIAMISLVMVVVAGVSALTHLGQPFRAMNALFGLGRSPMSNEIITCGLFGGLVFLYAVGNLKKMIPEATVNIIGYLSAIAGVALIILIPNVYQLETIPAWNTGFTSLQMVLTAVICGGAILTAVNVGGKAWLLTALATVLLFALTPGYFSFLSQANVELHQQDMLFWGAKYALLALGVLILVAAAFMTKGAQNARLAALASVLIVVGEIAGRIGFYDLWAIGM